MSQWQIPAKLWMFLESSGLILSCWHTFHEKQSFGVWERQEWHIQTSPQRDWDSWKLLPGAFLLPDGAALPNPSQQIPGPGAELPRKFWTLSSAQIPDVQPGSSQPGPGCSSPASLPKTRDGFQPWPEAALGVPKAAPEGETGADWDTWECSGSGQGKGFVRGANKAGKFFFPQFSVKLWQLFGAGSEQEAPPWIPSSSSSSLQQSSGFPIPLSPFFIPFLFLQEDP